MTEDKEKPVENGNGKSPIINIKLDKSFLMALVALLGVGGVGYGQLTKPGSDDLEAARTGADIQVNDAYRKLAGKVRQLAKVSRQQKEEIEWLAGAVDELGKSHPASLRKIKRQAPDYMAEIFAFEEMDEAEDLPKPTSPSRPVSSDAIGGTADEEDEVFESIDSLPEVIEFPAEDRIQAEVNRRK